MKQIIISAIVMLTLDIVYLGFFKNYFNKVVTNIQGSPIEIDYYATIGCYIAMVIGINYFILRENNYKEELIFGKKIKNQWEHAPHGKILMFYDNSDEKISAIPLRISKLERDESGKIKIVAKPNESIPSGSAFLNFKKDYTYAYGDDWIIE